MKTIFKRLSNTFICEKTPYINIKVTKYVLLKGNKYIIINDINSSDFYDILISKKFLKPITEKNWSDLFGIPSHIWVSIYYMKITKMTDKNIAEFNYKLLHKLLNNNLNVSKWNENVQMFCKNCGGVENIAHLLYECNDSSFVWQKLSSIFGFKIAWKHIVIGFYENSDTNDSMNTLISFVALKIYKYKMKCRLDNISSTNDSLYNSVKMSLNTYQYIVENSYENIQTHKLFKKAYKIM